MSQDEKSIEQRIQKALVDRDKLKWLEQRNAELKRKNEILRKTLQDAIKELGERYRTWKTSSRRAILTA